MSEKGIRIILIPQYMTKEELEAVGIVPSASVEAEYGDKVIEGELITLAHHIHKYINNPAPCNTHVEALSDNSTIVVSHIDLDTIGGCLALMGIKKEDNEFWKAVEFIDLNGPHHIHELSEELQSKFNAYWAYNSKNIQDRTTEIKDVTDCIIAYGDIIDRIIENDRELLEEGRKWEQGKEVVEKCLVAENEYVRVFNSSEGVFCSASYYSPNMNKVIPATVVLNGKYKSVTVAFADGGKQISAKDLVQELWGPLAGGHPGIAGSPRGQEMKSEDAYKAAVRVIEKYKEISDKNLDNRIRNSDDIDI